MNGVLTIADLKKKVLRYLGGSNYSLSTDYNVSDDDFEGIVKSCLVEYSSYFPLEFRERHGVSGITVLPFPDKVYGVLRVSLCPTTSSEDGMASTFHPFPYGVNALKYQGMSMYSRGNIFNGELRMLKRLSIAVISSKYNNIVSSVDLEKRELFVRTVAGSAVEVCWAKEIDSIAMIHFERVQEFVDLVASYVCEQVRVVFGLFKTITLPQEFNLDYFNDKVNARKDIVEKWGSANIFVGAG